MHLGKSTALQTNNLTPKHRNIVPYRYFLCHACCLPSHAGHGSFACISRRALSPRLYEVEPSVQFTYVSTNDEIAVARCESSEGLSYSVGDMEVVTNVASLNYMMIL